MSNVDLKRFVDINIEKHINTSLIGTRDTVVLFTASGSAGTTKLITSMTDATENYGSDENTLAYLKVFFNNSGAKVLVVEGKSYADLTVDDIAGLDDKYILVTAVIPDLNVEEGYAALKTLATTRAADTDIYGINEKLIISRTTTVSDTSSVKNFVSKYSTVLGAEMTIAAYLSKINIYKANTVYDYMFTQEVITAEDITDANYESLITNNMNVDIYLANATRNCGGNCKDGADVTNTFVRIMMHQTLTYRLVELLTEKIKGVSGINKIYNVISQELNNYLTCGYLTTDKIWTDEDLTIKYNEEEYTIITKGTALSNGYIVKVLPFNALSDSDKTAHKAPPIYVIVADQYGIRQITINGEII